MVLKSNQTTEWYEFLQFEGYRFTAKDRAVVPYLAFPFKLHLMPEH
jgi:hypothetical protein